MGCCFGRGEGSEFFYRSVYKFQGEEAFQKNLDHHGATYSIDFDEILGEDGMRVVATCKPKSTSDKKGWLERSFEKTFERVSSSIEVDGMNDTLTWAGV
jgi:hypothetical protein